MQIFHCQFPFNYKYDVLHHFDIEIKVFDKMIVNSDMISREKDFFNHI